MNKQEKAPVAGKQNQGSNQNAQTDTTKTSEAIQGNKAESSPVGMLNHGSIPTVEPSYKQLSLQPSLIEMLDVFNAKKPDYVSTLDFLSAGVLSPAAGVSRLKTNGAVIETETKTVIDRSGKSRKGIACYRLVGWVK